EIKMAGKDGRLMGRTDRKGILAAQPGDVLPNPRSVLHSGILLFQRADQYPSVGGVGLPDVEGRLHPRRVGGMRVKRSQGVGSIQIIRDNTGEITSLPV